MNFGVKELRGDRERRLSENLVIAMKTQLMQSCK